MRKIRIIFMVPLIILSATIFWLSHQPTVPFLNNSIVGMDKVLHFFAYFVYSITAFIGFIGFFNFKNLKYSKIFAILLALLFAFSDEYHQSFITGRDACVYDFIADAFGVLCAAFFFDNIYKVMNKKFNDKQISTDT